MASRLPSIENILKNSESLIFVLFWRKYVINPAKLEKRIMNVLVSTAILNTSLLKYSKKRISMIDTKNTPPPIPAIEESIPDRKPSKINNKTT